MKKYIAIIVVAILIAGNVNAVLVTPYGEAFVPRSYCDGQVYESSEDSGYIRCKEKIKEEKKEKAIEKAEKEARERKEYVVNLIEDETKNLGDRVEELEVQNEELNDKVEELKVQNEKLSDRITANRNKQDIILGFIKKILEILNGRADLTSG